jgi:hypothetical protein
MAKRFLIPINLLNAASDPETANEGDIYYNTASDTLKIYANSAWTSVSGGGSGGVTSLIGTANQINVSASSGDITASFSSTVVFPGTVTLNADPTQALQAATKQYVDSVVLNTQTDSYSLVLSDSGKTIEMNSASANSVTIPLNSSQAFTIGTTIDIVQYGSGQTTISPTSGVTIRSKDNNLKLSGQYSGATIYKRGTDEWVAFGDLTE